MAKKRTPIALPAAIKKKVARQPRVQPKVPKGLTDKEQRFVREYCLDLNATKAAIRAGYSKRSAAEIGFDNLRKPQIATAIAEWRARSENVGIMTLEEIKREMQKLAQTNVSDFFHIDASGQPHIDLSLATRDQLAALAEITVDDYVDGRGEDARDVKRTRIKVESKRQALMDLAKLKGEVTDKGEMVVKRDPNDLAAEAFRVGPQRAQQLADELGATIAKIRAELKA